MSKKNSLEPITWLSDETNDNRNGFSFYSKFQFGKIIAEVGDFVLISNTDAAEPDTEDGCDAAKILALYENKSNKNDPYRAKVQWYSKPKDLPSWCFNIKEPMTFLKNELIEDHRPFDTDVSIETFFKKCCITLTYTKDTQYVPKGMYQYFCRYRFIPISKRKAQIEPVMEEERKAVELLCTPSKPDTPNSRTPKTPSSLVKKMSRVSISEQKNWSVTKNDGTKLLLKRAIMTDKNEKESPNKATSKTHTPTQSSLLTTPIVHLQKLSLEEMVCMELKENSDEEELPTLFIRKKTIDTPKRKSILTPRNDVTPKKVLDFSNDAKETYSSRSGRIIKSNINYLENELSPVKRTPRKSVRKLENDSEDEFKPIPKTPKTPRTPRTSSARTPKLQTPSARTPQLRTPKRNVTRRIITSELTPTLNTRANSVDNSKDLMKENKSLPGREQQLAEIVSFVQSKVLNNISGCMYISGVPGTGKTATVWAALKQLKEQSDLPDFQLLEVNGMRIAEPRQAFVQIYKQLTGKTVVWEQACTLLEKRFTNPGPRRTPTVLLVDELDALCNRRQDVLYSILEWAAHDAARLAVLAVANTMDLPERALRARVASRLGLERLGFAPYSHAQLQAIVEARLPAARLSADAVQLVARKVAAVSGDARRAVALCARAVELGGERGASLAEVQLALREASSAAPPQAIRHCSAAEALMLAAIAAEVERTGSEETTLSRALLTAAALVALRGRPFRSCAQVRAPSPAQALALCSRLAAQRLVLLDARAAEPRLLLNVSVDDVHYAARPEA